ncbi:DUF2867 domain-containing protein [Parvibium lacunae]|uniref:DUF2867 domain-containing protein n=1 Tax=Parvibium lacunae TaxID=1888893 RepID=A0A368L4V8_9BURK|nr:DUF2867 domain-containing protein [Parvibium lacunae]RCS58621.1 DUF2867 domain-containing protein [Parvibium lacunae]
MSQVVEVPVPPNCAVFPRLHNADFYDAWRVSTRIPSATALEAFLAVVKATPPWVDFLMALRNRIVSKLGLKNLGVLSKDGLTQRRDYQPGERLGIFTVVSNRPEELLLTDQDKHLDVVISVYQSSANSSEFTISTVVHTHNWLGKLYMLPVAPLHKLIVRNMLSKVAV